MSPHTRRTALALMAAGGSILLLDSQSASQISADRHTNVSVGDDDSAIVRLTDFKENTTYEEPHEVTVTNKTGTDFTDTVNVSNGSGELVLRKSESEDASNSIDFSGLNDGETITFEVVTHSDHSGEVTDDIELTLEESGELSVRIERTLTVKFNESARMVYGLSDDMKLYDAVQETQRDPPDSGKVDVIGATVADVTGDGNVDIPYVDGSGDANKLYVTGTGRTSDELIAEGIDVTTSGTRLSVGEWPPADLSGPLVLYADSNNSNIYGADADGDTEMLLNSENDAGGVAGIADIDDDDEVEMVFMDGSAELRYRNQNGPTEKIENSSIGSNNSAGFGPPADFISDGQLRIPIVDGSNNIALIDYQGNKETIKGGAVQAKKASVAPVDIDLDDELEFMYFGNDDGKVKYIDDVGGSNSVEYLTIDGSQVSPQVALGLNAGTKLID